MGKWQCSSQFPTQHAKAYAFQALHTRPGAFVIPNPWDAGSARLLASLGFEALATTSAGLAFSLGRPDAARRVTRDETMANARAIVDSVGLPVSGDLENGFGDSPEAVSATIQLAAEIGLAGGSIEDASGDPANPIYPTELAVERVVAAAETARALPHPFVLTARAENFLHGRPNLDDTIRRLRAFEAAGADVLYAPGLPSLDAIRAVCDSVSKPVNVLAGTGRTVVGLAEAGVKRISLGSSLSRVALGAFMRAAEEIARTGSFDCLADALPYGNLNMRMGGK